MSERIETHKVDGVNRRIDIETLGERNSGNAFTKYACKFGHRVVPIEFTVNSDPTGITNEALLAIVKHRLESFQAGKYPNSENALAILDIDMALQALGRRHDGR